MEIRLIFYYLIIGFGAAVSAVFGYFFGKKKGFPPDTLKIFLALALIFGITGAVLMGRLQNFVMSLTGLPFYYSRMRIFGGLLFTPVFLYFPVKYLAGDFGLVTDTFCPGMYILLGFSKIACAVYGCCYGIPCNFGVYNRFSDCTVFPVQLLESVLCFMLFGLMYFYTAKAKHRKGTAWGLSIILYGVMRFVIEFLRYYTPEEKTFFFGINFWQAVSIITVAAGAVSLIYTCRGKSRGYKNDIPQCEE